MAPSLVASNTPSTEGFPGLQNPQTFTKSIYSSKDVSEFDLGQYWTTVQSTVVTQPIKESTFLKAAWILTLRCFQPEEVIQMSYDEGLAPKSGTPIIFTVPVNLDWDVRSLLETLEVEVPSSSLSYGSQLSQLTPFSSACAAALRYLTIPGPNFVSFSSVNGNLEVS